MPLRMPKDRSRVTTVAAILVALFLLQQAFVSARNGLSDIHARPAIDYLENKRSVDFQLSDEEWVAIEQNVARAAELMPGNPIYLESLGMLHQVKLGLFFESLDIEAVDRHARAATDYFREAAHNRPTWPYYWGNLALEHYRRGKYADAEYSQALANAARFGPWKSDTQRLVTDLGTDTWTYLTQATQHQVVKTIERGLVRQPTRILKIIDSYEAWPDVCIAVENGAIKHLQRVRSQCVLAGQIGNTSQRGPDISIRIP